MTQEGGTPHPDWTFELPRFEEAWGHCPECRSDFIEIRMAESEEEQTAWFQSDSVIWLECSDCGHESRLKGGDPVSRRDPAVEGTTTRFDQFKNWVMGLV